MSYKFKYKALTPDGLPQTGELMAENRLRVLEILDERRLLPLKIKAVSTYDSFLSLNFLKRLFSGASYENLIMFTANLSTMYRAGIPLLKALGIIRIGPKDSRFNAAIEQMHYKVQAGKSLSEAMKEFPDLFSQVYVASIAAGEESGKLEDIFEELSTMLEREMEIVRLVKSGLRYPIMVLSVIALAVMILMGYVVPRFISFYASFNAELPLPTRILIAASNFFTNYWYVVLALFAGSIYTLKYFYDTPKGKLILDKKLLKFPIFGRLAIKGNVARFSFMFRIMFRSGLPIIRCLKILADTVKNSAIAQEVRYMEDLFRRGAESELLRGDFQYFPELARQMMTIGLESGSLERMLHEVGNHYAKEVHYTSRQLTSILEPILTLFMSVLVLIMALAIFLPMWNLIKVFNGGG